MRPGVLISVILFLGALAVPGAVRGQESRLSPQELQAAQQAAQTHMANKQYRKAIEEFRKVLAANPGDVHALYNAACAYARLNEGRDAAALAAEKETAVAFLKKSIEAGWVDFTHMQNDTDFDSIRSLAGYQEALKSCCRKAIDEYAKVLAANPGHAGALYLTASAHALLNEKEKALAFLKQAVETGQIGSPQIEQDRNLDGIRGAAGFRELMEGIQSEAERRAAAVLDVMPDIGDRLESVDELIQEQKWERVLERLAAVVEEAGDTVWSPDGKVYVSVREFIRGRVMSLPAAGLAFYRLRYDGEARARRDEALARQDVRALDDVEEQYPASSVAPGALDAAANVLLDRGDFGGAAARLRRLLARPETGSADEARLRAMALAKLAFCQARLGDGAGAKGALERLRSLRAAAGRAAGGTVDMLAFLESELKRGPAVQASLAAADWPGPGGDLTHARPMMDVRPNLQKRWELKLAEEPGSAGRVAGRESPSAARRASIGRNLPQDRDLAPLPAADEDGVVYMNTADAVFAVDHITGRVRWMTRPDQTAPAPRQGQPPMQMVQADPLMTLLWSRSPGARSVSVGGGKVFAVETRVGMYPGISLALSAFDAGTGQRLWSVEQRPDGNEFETQAWFPWVPGFVEGPGGGSLVGVACYRDQLFLCSLDANTGKLNWKVFLCADPLRTTGTYGMTGGLPHSVDAAVIADGVAYAATGMGAVAAVDARTGLVRWVSTYPRSALQTTQINPRLRGRTAFQYSGSWQGGFPVLTGGRLYVAPWDSDSLLAFDCGTGELLKSIPRGSFTHLAGRHNGDLILVGPETAAMDPSTGLLRWLVPTPFEPSGLPVVTESAVLIPADGGTLCRIGLDGKVERTVTVIPGADMSEPLGNLICCQGRLVAVRPDAACGFFSFEDTYEYLSKEMAGHPGSARPVLDRSDLCFVQGKYADALADLQAAERLLADSGADAAQGQRLKRLMFETRLRLAEAEPAKAVEHVDAARKYIYDDRSGARFRLSRGAALTAAGRFEDAVDEYVAQVETAPSVRLGDGDSAELAGNAAQERIGDLVATRGERVYARMDEQLRPKFDALVRAKDADGLGRLQNDHPHSSLADNCLFEMAKIAAAEQNGAVKEQMLLRNLTLRYGRSELLGEAYARLLESCFRGSQYYLLAFTLKDVQEKHPDLVLPWEGRKEKSSELVSRLMERAEVKRAAMALAHALPEIRPPLREAWTAGPGGEVLANVLSDDNCFDRGIGIAVGVAKGRPPYEGLGRIDRVRAFETGTGRTLWTAHADIEWNMGDVERGNSPWSRSRFRALAVCSGNIVALCHPLGIVALDAATGKRVWEKTWTRPAGGNMQMWHANNMAVMGQPLGWLANWRPTFAADTGRIFYYIPDGRLACLDAATGREIWSKQVGVAIGPIGVFGDLVAVASMLPNRLSVHRALDGKDVASVNLPGQFPYTPVYDRGRNRVIVSDVRGMTCYGVADLKPVWAAKTPENVAFNPGQPWWVQVLPDGRIGVLRYAQLAHGAVGFEVAMYEGGSGKLMWKGGMDGSDPNDRNAVLRTNISSMPVFSGRYVFVPVQAQRVQQLAQGRRRISAEPAVFALGGDTGKRVRECRFSPKEGNPIAVSMLALAAAADRSVALSVEHVQSAILLKLHVLGADPKEETWTAELPQGTLDAQIRSILLQRIEPVLTIEGSVLVPTEAGIRCLVADGKPGARADGKQDEAN